MKTQALIVAAGQGTRLGRNEPKALISLNGRAMLAYSIEALRRAGVESPIVITCPADVRAAFETTLSSITGAAEFRLVPGGAERQDSVLAGLDALEADTVLVAIHDAARPFIDPDCIRRTVETAAIHGAATVAIPCVDTILVSDKDRRIKDVPERAALWSCQTPQVFRVDWLREGHERARREGTAATDDSRLVWAIGHPVHIVEGSPMNRKITTPDDLVWAEQVAAELKH